MCCCACVVVSKFCISPLAAALVAPPRHATPHTPLEQGGGGGGGRSGVRGAGVVLRAVICV